ncbi:peptide MFS transporter [Nocardioides bruguierae]|uniref:peptide MFS transporter n=1 Tax=Nocardioides bruguierae TaxID=2945102 RepID=UPI002021534C|nr:peptide MFS transporter [Nocardioides bruguierae]MCL8024941.1 peptide MFS transporter [Nocardioides bruguierae]
MTSTTTTASTPRPDPSDPAGGDRGFFGHPRPLAHLFGVEMWERFSFYGMQGILAIYLYFSVADGGLGLDRGVAVSLVGAYGGGVYLSTVLGAWLADRVAGPERVLFGSAIIVMAGHVALALLPGAAGVGVGLVLVALGSGGIKANATSLVGALYAEGDPRRDAGFSLFYMGINAGALVGPLLTGLLQSRVGFHWGFGLAALGMALGLTQYAVGRRHLPASTAHVPNPLSASGRLVAVGVGLALVVVVAVAVLTGLLTASDLADVTAVVVVVAMLAFFVQILRSREITATERSRVWAFVPLMAANVVFWALYQQQFTVVAVYSDVRLDRDLLGWEMPISWVNSINPVFIIALAPLFAAAWTRLGPRQPSTPVKFGLGTVLMGVAFWLFLAVPGGEGAAPLPALAGILLVFTLAELLISPVGLSLATKLAPQRFATRMVALYFLSVSLGTTLAGSLGAYYDPEAETGYFAILGAAAVLAGLLVLVATKPIGRLMAGVR